MTDETAADDARTVRLKRMRLRSWRRGTREMDLVLGPFADTCLEEMTTPELDLFERLIGCDDTDLDLWIMGRAAPPDVYLGLVLRITEFATERAGAPGGVDAR